MCTWTHLLILKMVKLPKIKRRGFFSHEIASLFCVTHSENSEVQIAVVLKRNKLWDWKLVQGFIFCLSSTLCKWEFIKPRCFDFTIWWRHLENHVHGLVMNSALGSIKEGLNGVVAVTVIISFGSFTAIG